MHMPSITPRGLSARERRGGEAIALLSFGNSGPIAVQEARQLYRDEPEPEVT